jgi:IS30 family transposase
MSYKQLTLAQRYEIRAYMQLGFSKTHISTLIKVHKSTVCRELQRNTGLIHYIPLHAQMRAESRRRNAHKHVRFTGAVKWRVETLLKKEFSPEQISGYLAKKHQIYISHETIYNPPHAIKFISPLHFPYF